VIEEISMSEACAFHVSLIDKHKRERKKRERERRDRKTKEGFLMSGRKENLQEKKKNIN